MTQRNRDIPLSLDLLGHAAALRRLAHGILRDAHAAEDVVQETWLQALKSPPARTSEPDGLRGWLSTVARSLALRRVRGDGRRSERELRARDLPARSNPSEATGAPDAEEAHAASPAALAERRQSLERLTGAVLALDEPYQAAILLRFYDDLPPREIARQLGVPVATVKSRIARGLARLRAEVEEGCREDGTDLFRALAFLVAPAPSAAPWPSPDSTADSTTSGSTGGAASAPAAGMIAMGMQGKVAAGFAALCVVGLVAWQRDGREVDAVRRAPRAESAEDPRVAADLAGPDAEALTTAGGAPERAPLAPAAAGGFVDATGEPTADPFEFTLEGRVTDWSDLALAGATVYVAPLGAPLNIAGQTDADGRFRVSWSGPRSSVELVLDVHGGGASSGLRRLRLGSETHRVALRLTQPSGSYVSLDATLPDVTVVGGVEAQPQPLPLAYLSVNRLATPSWTPDFEADETGRGRFSRVIDECVALNRASQPQLLSFMSQLGELEGRLDAAWVVSGARMDAEPSPSVGGTLTGLVKDAAGEPVPHALIALGSAPGRGDGPRASTGPDGSFRLEGVEPGIWHVRAGGVDHGVAERVLEAADGAEVRWEAYLDRGHELIGRLVDAEDQSPLGGWVIEVEDGAEVADTVTTEADGSFAIPNLPRRAVRVLARPSHANPGASVLLSNGVVPGRGELTLTVEAGRHSGGAELRLTDEDGKLCLFGVARLWNTETERGLRFSETDEAFALREELPEGSYEGEIVIPFRESQLLGPMALGALGDGEIHRLGPAILAARGAIDIEEDEVPEGLRERWRLRLWHVEGDARELFVDTAGPSPARLKLPAGAYELDLVPNPDDAAVAEALAEGLAPPARRLAFVVSAGERQVLRIHRGQGVARAAIEAAGDAPLPEERSGDLSATPEELPPVAQALLEANGEEGRYTALNSYLLNSSVEQRANCSACH